MIASHYRLHRTHGFTLVELAIVLVIIGLVIGGVLVGRDMVNAASIHAQITQIDKYNAAVRTFQNKYGCLPGDCAQAAQFGFVPRQGVRSNGNGDGALEGAFSGSTVPRMCFLSGELAAFWRDLTEAGLIDGGQTIATAYGSFYPARTPNTSPSLDKFMPPARIGQGNYVYAYSEIIWGCCGTTSNAGTNYFGLSRIETTDSAGALVAPSSLGLSVQQAFAIDTKTDNGVPQTGRVTARFPVGNNVVWASGAGSYTSLANQGALDTSATAASATSCFDNGSIAGVTQQYSMANNGGSGMNCALSFRFQ